MAISLDKSDGTMQYVKVQAFSLPVKDDTLRWDVLAPDVAAPSIYNPYLIRILSTVEYENLTFVGVDLATGLDIAGQSHYLSLAKTSVVWADLPSTLSGYVKGVTEYAILFLTDKYPRSAEIKAARGGGKYPIAKGELLAKLQLFSDEARGEAKAKFDQMFAEYLRGE